MARRATRLAALLVGVSAGCVHYSARPLDPAASAAAFDARCLDDPALLELVRTIDPQPPGAIAWDTASLTVAALHFNPELGVKLAESGTAAAGIQAAGERPNPTVSIGPSYDAATSDKGSTVSVTSSVDFPIETAGKRGHRIAAATRRAEAARLQAEQALWETRTRIHEALLDLTAGAASADLAAGERRLVEERVAIEEKRLAVGSSPRLDLLAARKELADLAASEARRVRDAGAARARLAAVVGVPVRAIDDAQVKHEPLEPLPAVDALDRAALRRAALVLRPDLRAGLAAYAAAEEDLELQVAKQYPDLHLGPGFAWDEGQARWSLGLGFDLPIFSRNHGPIAEAEAKRAEEARRFEALQARVLQDIDAALAAYRAASAMARAAETGEGALAERARAVETRFEAGEVGRGDLVDARLELARARNARVDALVEAHRALVALEGASQEPVGSGAPLDAALAAASTKGGGS